MKCPKCDYLGFDTGDRCRNCGYDFSLMVAAPEVPDLALRLPEEQVPATQPAWLDQLDGALGESHVPRSEGREPASVPPRARPAPRSGYSPPARPAAPGGALARMAPPLPERPAAAATLTPPAFDPPAPPRPAPVVPDLSLHPPMPPPAFRGEPPLPLFSPASEDDDRPLITVPAAPRQPLSVRRTPDTPRLRPARVVEKGVEKAVEKGVEKRIERPAAEPTLFIEDPEPDPAPAPLRSTAARPAASLSQAEDCTPGARVVAAVLDYLILGTIDAIVLYFTLRLAGLAMGEWQALPALPMIAFLLLLKVAYFTAFTAVGGQTIGKMAAGIRVVADDADFVEPARAIRRALGGVVSLLTLGAGFVPVLVGANRRALHDRLARTRVIALPSA